ncbi:MAG: hypothetical protein QXS27_01600 [Candidatus Jordarchaeaceae archaeon]|nr:hypothetical protein [Candidatus Jordarchaeia archaeon]MBS7269407.1 hypothetical protein [Candidatus Jordarchaeia archaeon]MBS7280195.1 hypothetical protein [Candidatus Jordarchaeia archaeon]
MRKTQGTPKNKKEDAKEENPLDFGADLHGLGSDMLYPCCMSGNCSLYFYYEEMWRKEEQKEKNTPKTENRGEQK